MKAEGIHKKSVIHFSMNKIIIYTFNTYNSILWLKPAVFYEQTLYFTALKETVPENYL